ncbi:hypothetical protein NM208_g8877 [Fusarium decemcellulare]|uniref:Uncharacterized protein n=1 Tax=Fusarium decemcellulare TaxID=57161 RepID=A0ACC1S3Y1_9HYPO|nr:hypothetical protein NM208_g8877 [Fusarium decemcellulare]
MEGSQDQNGIDQNGIDQNGAGQNGAGQNGTDPWSGVRVCMDLTSRSAYLKAGDNSDLAESICSLEFPTHFALSSTQQELKTAILRDWTQFEDDTMNRPTGFFVGYSVYNLEPVILRASGFGDTTDDLSTGCALWQMSRGLIKSSEVILTAAAAVPGNISAMKTAMKSGRSLIDVFKGRIILPQVHASRTSLKAGRHPHVVQRDYLLRSGIDEARPPLTCSTSQGTFYRMPSSLYPPELRMVPNARPYIFRGKLQRRGFLYNAPYMANMCYPPLLSDKLQQFAAAHPNDTASIKSMLFAVQLWCDIKADPNRQKEAFLADEDTKKTGIPDVPIDKFILGFEHWLRHHEEKKLLEYIHPYRFIHTFFSRDLTRSRGSPFRLKPEDRLNSTEIQDLVAQVRPKLPGTLTRERFVVFPASMPGSEIPWPAGMLGYTPPTPVQTALLNFDNIYSYGLPSYSSTNRLYVKIAMPKIVASNRLGKLGFQIDPNSVRSLRDPQSLGTASLFGGKTAIGPIWKTTWKSRATDTEGSVYTAQEPAPRLGMGRALDQLTAPRITQSELAELMIPLEHSPRVLSLHWRDARARLKDLNVGGPDERNCTFSRIKDIIQDARDATKQDLHKLKACRNQLFSSTKPITRRGFIVEVVRLTCRLTGFEPPYIDIPQDGSGWDGELTDAFWDLHGDIGEKLRRFMESAHQAKSNPQKAVAEYIDARIYLNDLYSRKDFWDQGKLLETEYHALAERDYHAVDKQLGQVVGTRAHRGV